jgi:diguanylate cyclase (GGDEF)-like protein/PAS domain S-box-containing protein
VKVFATWSLRERALALLLLAQVVGLALLFWNGNRIANETAEAELLTLRERVLPGLANAVAPALFEQDFDQFRRLLNPWATADGILALELVTERGQILHSVRNTSAEPGAEPVTLSLPVTVGPMRLGQLVVTIDESRFRAVARRSTWSAMFLVAVGLSSGTVLLVLFALRLGRQLLLLAQAARAIAAGDTAVRVRPEGPPELRTLAETFNAMVERLLETNRHLEAERRRLAESEARFRDFASAASDWFWETDAEHRFTYLSRQDDPTHPIGQERLLGRRRDEVMAGCDPAALAAHLADLEARRPFRDFRYWIRDRNGRLRTIEVSGIPQFDAEGRFRGYRGAARDVTERIEAEERIRHLARHDMLTPLANRAAFTDHLRRALALARREGLMVALHVIDLDGFRRINDAFGHNAGDALLLEVARRIALEIREGDVAARLAADEFAVLQPGVRDPAEATALAERLVQRLRQVYDLDGRRLQVTASAGIALFPNDAQDAESLLRHAGVALARAKAEGRARYRFFEPEMEAAEKRRRRIEVALREAVERADGAGLSLCIQPRVDLLDGSMVGAEALLRWRHPELGEVSPAVFVPLAEQTGLVHALGSWVLREACRLLAGWHERLPPSFRLAVNLSPLQFSRRDLVREVAEALAASAVPAERLELEITESALMQDTRRTAAQLTRLRELGVALALDDFGTGYSSLGYLKRFALDKIKIDRSFVMGLDEGHENAAIVRAIITLARSLELDVVAEGVESEAQRAFLLREGCREAQGYLFAAPLPTERFERVWLPRAAPLAAPVAAFARPDFLLPAPSVGD